MSVPSTLTIARRLVTRGLSVFPVPPPRLGARPGEPGDGKVPAMKWGTYQHRLPTPQELSQWFQCPRMNIAVVTGACSGVVVIDLDSEAALTWARAHLPQTPWQTETAKGLHLWFQHPGVPVANRARLATDAGKLLLDVRGDGGYVMAPGSVHATGHRYRCLGDWHVPRVQLPRFCPSWLDVPVATLHEEVTKHSTRAVVDAHVRARAYLAATPRPEIGHGSDLATFTAACRLVRGFALSELDTEHLLWEWAGDRPGWTRGWITQKVQSAHKHGKELIGALL